MKAAKDAREDKRKTKQRAKADRQATVDEEIVSKHAIFKLTDWDQFVTLYCGVIPGCCCFFDYFLIQKYKKLYQKGYELL